MRHPRIHRLSSSPLELVLPVLRDEVCESFAQAQAESDAVYDDLTTKEEQMDALRVQALTQVRWW